MGISFGAACAFEAAFLAAAWIWLAAAGKDPRAVLGCNGSALLWGAAGAIPTLAGFFWMLWRKPRRLEPLRRLLLEKIAPLFAGWTAPQAAVLSALAGLGEELLFRGALQGWLQSRIGPVGAILLAAAAFGLAHPLSLRYALATAAVGAYFGWLAVALGGVAAPAVAHGLHDFVAILWIKRRAARSLTEPGADRTAEAEADCLRR